MTPKRLLASALLAAVAIASQSATAADAPAQASWYSGTYQVTITNLTRGTSFTPLLVASHSSGIHLFELGSPASPELRTLAEEGNTMPLADLLESTQGVHDVATGNGLTAPGATTTLQIRAGLQDRISLAAMLIPTNDGFVAIDAAEVPLPHRTETLYANGYDAGTEQNDELCASIPGPDYPECGGPGGGAQAGNGEGYVFVHAGIHGVGDFDPANRDWRNPVAKIVITRMH
jgi:Spondin_N